MKIASAASAIPKHRYAQGVITEALKFHWAEKLERPGVLERLHTRTGVHYRHLAFSFEEYKRLETWGQTNAAWLEVAQDLGATAIDVALERAQLERQCHPLFPTIPLARGAAVMTNSLAFGDGSRISRHKALGSGSLCTGVRAARSIGNQIYSLIWDIQQRHIRLRADGPFRPFAGLSSLPGAAPGWPGESWAVAGRGRAPTQETPVLCVQV